MVLPVSGFAQPNVKIVAKQSVFEDEIVDSSKEKQSMLKSHNLKDSNQIKTLQNQIPPDIEAESYLLKDYESGIVLAEKNQDQPRPPASMTKMMTAYIVLDKIQKRELHWTDEVVISKRVEAINEAQIFLQENG